MFFEQLFTAPVPFSDKVFLGSGLIDDRQQKRLDSPLDH